MLYCKQINDDRLGNQLFRFANIYAMAKRHNTTIRMDWKFNYKDVMRLSMIERGEPTPGRIKLNYAQPNLGYNEIPYINGMNLDGYFQSEKYFEDYSDQIRKMFRTFGRKNNTCAIHVRRGDYLELQGVLPVLPMNYYLEAIRYVKENWKMNDFVVYSDDPDWCEKNFVCPVMRGTPIEDFEAMQQHPIHIIANSTFSWWAAWLAGHDRVVAPKKWFGQVTEMFVEKDIVPGRWVKI